MNNPGVDLKSLRGWLEKKDFQKTIEYCESILKTTSLGNNENIEILRFLGTAQYFSGKFGKSIEQFKKILSIDPKNTDAAIALSVIYNDIGKYDEARSIYKLANQSLQNKSGGSDSILDRKFSLKHIEIGDLYFKYHRHDEALEEYSKALRLSPEDLSIRIKLAKVYAKKGFTSRATQELQQLCREHPNLLIGRIQLGLMYFSLGNVIDAQLEWERALELEPKNQEVLTYIQMAKQATETIT